MLIKYYNKIEISQEWSQAGWNFMFVMLAVFLISFMPGESFASGGTGDAIGNTLCTITTALTGTWGKAIATVAIVALGIGLFLGKLSWGLAISTAIGVGMIFSASTLAVWLGGSSGTSCSAS